MLGGKVVAISKELKPFLDVDAKGQYKKTRKNVSKLLAYYGYTVKDIQEVFGTTSDIYSRYIDDKMLKREQVTSRHFFTDEEKEFISEYEKDIDRVYATLTSGSKDTGVKKATGKAKLKKPSGKVNLEKPVTTTRLNDLVEGSEESTVTSPKLLNKLHKITEKETSKTRQKVEENREKQTPVKSEAPSGGKCARCGGRGWTMEKQSDGVVRKTTCPDCLGQPVRTESADFDRFGKPLLEELIENKNYLKSKFSTRTLVEDNIDAYRVANRQFENYVEFLSGVLTEVSSGDVPLKSYYIATPDGYGKKNFIYQIMKEMVSYGYKPTHLLNGGLLLDLYNKREFKELNDLLDGDMIFVTISALSKTHGIGNIIKYIADVAERRGVPVIMVGRVSVEIFLKDKDFNLPTLLGRHTANGDYGHFQCEGFFGKDFIALAKLQQERMSGSLISNN